MNSNKCDTHIIEIADAIGTNQCCYDKNNNPTKINNEEVDDHQEHHQQ